MAVVEGSALKDVVQVVRGDRVGCRAADDVRDTLSARQGEPQVVGADDLFGGRVQVERGAAALEVGEVDRIEGAARRLGENDVPERVAAAAADDVKGVVPTSSAEHPARTRRLEDRTRDDGPRGQPQETRILDDEAGIATLRREVAEQAADNHVRA